MSNQAKASRIINILLLGQRGTGKSTFINSIGNYFTYENFDEAMEANEPICLIPSSFNVTLKNGSELNIFQLGINAANIKNEADGEGTQEPRVYCFYKDGIEVNIIDTPGMGSVQGIFQDARNKKLIN